MKVFKKLIVIISIIMLVCIFFAYNSVFASEVDGFIDTIQNNYGTEGMSTVQNIIGTVINLVRIVGSAVAVIILLVIGTKYIIASAGERADIKKYALNYVIGAIIFLSGATIVYLIKNFMERNVSI